MSTLANLQPQIHEIPKRLPQTVIPIKVGIFGGQGSGKSTSAALLALALSKQFHNGAPVMVTDTEPGWQFLRPIFAQEGVELFQRTEPTFRAMMENIKEAQRLGCCVWAVDSLTVIWQEILKSARGDMSFISIDRWGPIKDTWNQYVTAFMNSPMHCLALGRLQNDLDELIDEQSGKTKLVKMGTKFKAGGGESFGYEPHLLLELSLERKAKRKAGEKLEGEGRMIHRVDVLKDRTWALNGSVIRWSDKNGYKPGGWSNVWESMKPHFAAVQKTMAMVTIKSGSSAEVFDTNGDSEHYRAMRRKELLSAELHASMEYMWGGQTADAKKMRMDVFERIFGFRTKEAADQAPIASLERGVRILQAFEKPIKAGTSDFPTTKEKTFECLDYVIQNFDGNAEEEEAMPF